MDRHRRLGRRRADAMDVVARREQRVEVARPERAALGQLDALVVDLLVLGAAVEADETPGQVVVDRRRRARRDDQREQRERAVPGAEQQPLADAAAHAAVRVGLLEALREPVGVGEQLRRSAGGSRRRPRPGDAAASMSSRTPRMKSRTTGVSSRNSSGMAANATCESPADEENSRRARGGGHARPGGLRAGSGHRAGQRPSGPGRRAPSPAPSSCSAVMAGGWPRSAPGASARRSSAR